MSARLRLTRDSGFVDFIRRYEVVVNGEVVGRIKNGGTLECAIPHGKISVQLRVDWCGSNAIEVEVFENAEVRLECGSNLRGWKAFRAREVMRESPQSWIWLKAASRGGAA